MGRKAVSRPAKSVGEHRNGGGVGGKMRVQVADRVTLFDGRGTEAEAEVTDLGRNRCELQVQTLQPISREPPCEVDLAIALPKPDRALWLSSDVKGRAR